MRRLSILFWLFVGETCGVAIGATIATWLVVDNIPAALLASALLGLFVGGTFLVFRSRPLPNLSRLGFPRLQFSLRALLLFVTLLGVLIIPIGMRVFRAISRRHMQFLAIDVVRHSVGLDAKVTLPEEVTTLVFTHGSDDKLQELMPHLRQFPNLKVLHLKGQRLTDTSVECLAELSGLEELYFYDSALTDQSAKHLRRLSSLKRLFLSGDRMTDQALPDLAAIQNLEKLGLSSPKFTDDGVAALAPLSKLQQLDITSTSITDVGLKELGRNSKATILAISDSGKVRRCPK
jgi:Leucine-rich repeat (LRR) protein